MKLGFNFTGDLSNLEDLKRLDLIFLEYLKQNSNLCNYRNNEYNKKTYSQILIDLSPYVDDFLAELFNISNHVKNLQQKAPEYDVIYECKRKFVARIAVKSYPKNSISEQQFLNAKLILQGILGENFSNYTFASHVLSCLNEANLNEYQLQLAAIYAAYIAHTHSENICFNLPLKINHNNLLTNEKISRYQPHTRYGFAYNGGEISLDNAQDQSRYCLYCHKLDKDSCSKGLVSSKGSENIAGCPLKQKISEMNYVANRGFYLAALGIIIIDNPMVAATGHRICNDCMNSCIFQQQDPVNIPIIESNILDTILSIPWGFEIYSLLIRWNPLNIIQHIQTPYTGFNILIAGLGPAGFSLAYYLLNSGHNVIAIEGLKINPLSLSPLAPIKDWAEFVEKSQDIYPQGFGGVAEYGITPRWDKSKLLAIRLLLSRYQYFKIYSSVKLGNNITIDQALKLGFDQIGMCIGAAPPKFLASGKVTTHMLNHNAHNFFTKGVRTAAEFLMALQSGGAFNPNNFTSLLIRMPIAVIGGGLTAIDAAIEAMNYYPLQVEKFLIYYEEICNKFSTDYFFTLLNEEDKIIAQELLNDAYFFRTLKNPQAIRLALIQKLGGVKIYYKGSIKDSQGYKLNHEEVCRAIADGVQFIENMSASYLTQDTFGYCKSIVFSNNQECAARSILIAVGLQHTTSYIHPELHYFGDTNPKYAGSVVKALASTKDGYSQINKRLHNKYPKFKQSFQELISKLDHLLISNITSNKLINHTLTQLTINSPQATQNYQPGQFFKLQNYSLTNSKLLEPLALSPINVDKSSGNLSFIITNRGRTTKLCNQLDNETVALMGPCGENINILKNVLLVGYDLHNLNLLPIAQKLRQEKVSFTFLAYYTDPTNMLLLKDIILNSNRIIWGSKDILPKPTRETDYNFRGSLLEAIEYISLVSNFPIDQIIINSPLDCIEDLKNTIISSFSASVVVNYMVNNSMQCMMGGICGQCLINTPTEHIFTCKHSVLNIRTTNLPEIKNKLNQNSVQEKLFNLLE